jgi:hypothetical protein
VLARIRLQWDRCGPYVVYDTMTRVPEDIYWLTSGQWRSL